MGIVRVLVKITRSIHRKIVQKINYELLSQVGGGFVCDYDVSIYGGENITLGCNVVINKGVILQSCEGARIEIGDNVTFSYNAKLLTGNLNYQNKKNGRHSTADIRIGNGVWIGSNVIILPGVNIADNVVIGAGSIVTKSLTETNSIYGGIPAKKIKSF